MEGAERERTERGGCGQREEGADRERRVRTERGRKVDEEGTGAERERRERTEMEISSRRTAQKHTEAKTPPRRQAIPVGKLISAPDSRIPLL